MHIGGCDLIWGGLSKNAENGLLKWCVLNSYEQNVFILREYAGFTELYVCMYLFAYQWHLISLTVTPVSPFLHVLLLLFIIIIIACGSVVLMSTFS